MIEDFEDRWRELIARQEAATREVDATSSLRMICGVDAMARPVFFVILHQKPGLPHLNGAVSVERRYREQDDTWTLTLLLNRPALTEEFVALVCDLASKCARELTERDALARFLETVEDWQELLRERKDRLSEQRLRGLVAELWFGFKSGHHGHDLATTVRSWSGPYRADQDFTFPAPAPRFEVKAVRPTTDVVEVSSASQLDGSGIQMAAVTLDWASDERSTLTLPRLIADVRGTCLDPEVRVDFMRRVTELQINLDDPWYADQRFQVQRLRTFDVTPEFPALRRSELAPAIAATKYRLDLSMVTDYVLTDEDYLATREGAAP